MAVVWLNQSVSAWNTPSAWYYWDEDTQSAQPYGRIPQAGDTVYLNGYDITGTLTSLTFMGKLSNALNPYTNRSGGRFTSVYGNSHTFKEIEVGNAHFMGGATNGVVNITFTAEIINLIGSGLLYNKGGTGVANISVIGNIYRNSLGDVVWGAVDGGTFTLTGNISSEHTFSSKLYNIMIVGNASVKNAPLQTAGTLEINGNVSADNTYFYAGTSAIINGSMAYKNYEPLKGLIRVTTLSVPDNFIVTNEGDVDVSAIFTKYTMNNRQQYPSEDVVKEGVEYVWGEKVGSYQQPPESVVLKGYIYDNGDKIGSLENQNIVGCVTKEDVREGVPLLGMGEVGTLVVPSVDDVREGVVFDNGSVGTLIVQGGGDRLRIADFGYYTNAQSDTYIVDITDADKPKFASAEERILIEMFPTLDLDNIPEMYFDDLFVKYLKYRLIVEYYRTAGVNSTFTPSEPTTEIVNYRNVTCEVWLNSANTYLNAWNKKFGLNKPPQRVRL